MIDRAGVLSDLSDEDIRFIRYVKEILHTVKPTVFVLFPKEPRSTDLITSEEEELKNRAVELFNLNVDVRIIPGDDEAVIASEISSLRIDTLFFRYRPKLIGTSVAEKLLDDVGKFKLWVYKDKGYEKCSISNLCVPVDFSESSSRQLSFVEYLKNFFELRVTLVHMLDMERFKEKLDDPDYERIKRDREEETAMLSREFFTEEEYSLEILEGDPYDDLVDFINSRDFDLIIVGKRSLRERKSLGSVSENVLRDVECPMVVL